MKKMILTVPLLLALAITLSACAEVAHHPDQAAPEVAHNSGNQAAPEMTQMNMEKMDTSVQQMQEMRKKIVMEKDPATQKKLMHQHMQMMHDCMNMMGDKAMMGMMEKKMMMMQEMMNGMLMQQEMMMK